MHGTVKKYYQSSFVYQGSIFTHFFEWIMFPFSFFLEKSKNIFENTPRNLKNRVLYESEGVNKRAAILLVRAKGGDPFGNVDR